MIGKGAEHEEPASLNEVLEILEQRKKDRELTYEQQLAYEHVKKFASGGKAKEEKLKKALKEAGLGDRAVMKVLDIMPKNIMTLKQILAHENRTFDDAELAKILASIKENA
jgi:DNA-directed RNA polymerase subunit F